MAVSLRKVQCVKDGLMFLYEKKLNILPINTLKIVSMNSKIEVIWFYNPKNNCHALFLHLHTN